MGLFDNLLTLSSKRIQSGGWSMECKERHEDLETGPCCLEPPPFVAGHESTGCIASIIIVTYNHREHIDACLDSIAKQRCPHEVIVVDNCSSDGTPDHVRQKYPDVICIDAGGNLGYARANNLGVSAAKGEIMVILNPDTRVSGSWLEHLVRPVTISERCITTPKILMYDGKQINTVGNINHFAGLSFTNGLWMHPLDNVNHSGQIGISGTCFALKKSDFERIGRLDERFFLYNEDSDFSWRAKMMGYRIMPATDALVYHDYDLRMSCKKLYHLEKGRYIILRKYFSWREFVIFAPSLVLAEVLTFGYSGTMGPDGVAVKCRALIDSMREERCKMQGNSRDLFRALSFDIPVDQLSFGSHHIALKKLANRVFSLNQRCFNRICRIQ
jgi:GT2 family glycosyltransferase